MSNPLKGEVSFEVEGKSHTIRLNTNAICTLEAKIGVAFGEVTRRLDGFDFLTLRAVLRQTLEGEKTFADVDAIIDEIGYPKAVNYVMEAYRLAYPPADEATSP